MSNHLMLNDEIALSALQLYAHRIIRTDPARVRPRLPVSQTYSTSTVLRLHDRTVRAGGGVANTVSPEGEAETSQTYHRPE